MSTQQLTLRGLDSNAISFIVIIYGPKWHLGAFYSSVEPALIFPSSLNISGK